MKKIILVLFLYLITNNVIGQELTFHKSKICFCQGFATDSLIVIFNDSIIYSGYIDSSGIKQEYQLTYSFSYDDSSKVSLRVIIYMNQNHFEEIKLKKILPHKYNKKPSLDLRFEVYKNLLPKYIYFEGSLDRVYFIASEEEIIYK